MKKFLIAMLLVLALTASAFAASFADVPSSHWAYQAVNKLIASGILSGYPDGTFKGQNNLSRYEIAVVVARVLEEIEAEQAALADKVEDAANNLSIGEAQQVNQIVKSLVAKNTGEELSNQQADEVRSIVQALTYEFKPELTDLGVAVDELDSRLTAVEADVEGLKASKPKITFGAWGRAIFAPWVEADNGDSVPIQTTSWGWDNARLGFTLKGENEDGTVGVHVDHKYDGGETNTHQDQQKIWVKPFDNLTVEVGPSVFYDTLRGDSAYGAWNWLRFNEQDDEDVIFARGKAGKGDQSIINHNGGLDEGIYAGALIHYDRDGFHAFTSLDQSDGHLRDENKKTSETEEYDDDYTTSDMFQRGQYGFGYEIPGVGLVRAQYIGKVYLEGTSNDPTEDKVENYGVFNAALKLDNLAPDFTLDVGYFHPTEEFKDTGDSKHGYKQLNAYANYTGIESWTLHSTVQTKFDKEDEKGDEDLGFGLGFGTDYNFAVADGLMAGSYTVNTDLRYFNENWTGYDDSIGALVGISKNYDNGKIGIGLEYTSTQFAGEAVTTDTEEANWTIPIVLEYWF
ncbi:S-layer homology domain-containing protein [Halocella sp. SP3-1]|uniref:S-layer homology domain-containing protein n=1 Tax=Halocella sp. SP3-1 TaxID=2382161 RepID=UPI000F759E02|nr:S-layer homology domain-containing protein [Halocella sp. SP3-1]AZO95141.1 S-layer homology domain-containing protein [Halocella sp. SP3-1]